MWRFTPARARRTATARRALSSAMPPGPPHFFARINGVHRHGLMRDTLRAVDAHGATLAAVRKIRLGNQMSVLMHITAPRSVTRDALQRELSIAVGPSAACVVEPLEPGAVSLDEDAAGRGARQRRLTMTSPQRPDLIIAVADLLTAQGCTISQIEARTFVGDTDGALHFHLDAAVDCASVDNIDAITSELETIAGANKGLKISFDESDKTFINLMEHA